MNTFSLGFLSTLILFCFCLMVSAIFAFFLKPQKKSSKKDDSKIFYITNLKKQQKPDIALKGAIMNKSQLKKIVLDDKSNDDFN